MKRISLRYLSILWLLGLLLGSGCRDRQAGGQSDSGTDFSFGQVMAVTTNASLEVKEYDFTKAAHVIVAYQTTAQTEFGNIAGLAELQPGDDVVIDYTLKDGLRVVSILVKEESSGKTDGQPGRLVIAPDFQQIGDTEDGGGIMRAMSSTMALLSTNPVEQVRLATVARDAAAPTPPTFETAGLSGIDQWLSTNSLPDPAGASQVGAFGPWKLWAWGRGLSDSTVALYRSNALQFAWQGVGLATTGPLRIEKPGGETWTPFEGPPAGTDLDGDGVPDLLIYDYSGGAHCCSTVKHIVCSDPPVLTAQISGWHSIPTYRDVDGDGRYELILCDSSYAYWNASYAASPQPEVIFRIRNGHYEMDGDLMRRHGPPPGKTEATLKELKHRLSRLDQFHVRVKLDQLPQGELTAEEKADEDFFFGQCWHQNGVRIPPAVWDLLLDLIYSGQVEVAVDALDSMWPPGKPNKDAFANDLLEMIRRSWHGSRLPWFDELEKAFAQHYPPPENKL